MREFTAPDTVEVASDDNLAHTVVCHAEHRPDAVLFRRKTDGQWRPVTAAEFHRQVVDLAKGLVASGVEPGDKVALMSCTAYEWTLTDYAIWSAGAVTVPVYETSSTHQVEWILSDSGATVAFAQTDEHAKTIEQARAEAPDVKAVWTFANGAVAELTAAGAEVADEEIRRRVDAVPATALATIVYTSGTTGRPKGCRLTHHNLLHNARSATRDGLDELLHRPDASTLLFLPLAHVFARIIQTLCVENAVPFGHCGDQKQLLDDLAGFQPSFILAVPRVFEKVYNSAANKAALDGKGKIFNRAAQAARDYSRALDTGGPGAALRAKHRLFDMLVYRKLRAVMGGQVRFAVSGGGPLGIDLAHFFRGIGLVVLEGYGLTETSPIISVNLPGAVRLGTVGPPIGGTSVRIADDGEVLVQGPLVFAGYWNNDEATKDSFDDEGWLHTGDLGELDDAGYLRITGRKKEIIVTAGGKNVSPSVLEDRLRMHPLVSQCMVVGDNRPYIGVLVTLDAEALPGWLAEHGKQEMSADDARTDADVRAAIQEAVDDANEAVSRAESIKRFRIVPGDWTVEGGQLAAKMSVKRDVVAHEQQGEIDTLYA